MAVIWEYVPRLPKTKMPLLIGRQSVHQTDHMQWILRRAVVTKNSVSCHITLSHAQEMSQIPEIITSNGALNGKKWPLTLKVTQAI